MIRGKDSASFLKRILLVLLNPEQGLSVSKRSTVFFRGIPLNSAIVGFQVVTVQYQICGIHSKITSNKKNTHNTNICELVLKKGSNLHREVGGTRPTSHQSAINHRRRHLLSGLDPLNDDDNDEVRLTIHGSHSAPETV